MYIFNTPCFCSPTSEVIKTMLADIYTQYKTPLLEPEHKVKRMLKGSNFMAEVSFQLPVKRVRRSRNFARSHRPKGVRTGSVQQNLQIIVWRSSVFHANTINLNTVNEGNDSIVRVLRSSSALDLYEVAQLSSTDGSCEARTGSQNSRFLAAWLDENKANHGYSHPKKLLPIPALLPKPLGWLVRREANKKRKRHEGFTRAYQQSKLDQRDWSQDADAYWLCESQDVEETGAYS